MEGVALEYVVGKAPLDFLVRKYQKANSDLEKGVLAKRKMTD